MVFSSLIFLYAFLPLVLALYFLIPKRGWQNTVLIFTSLFFYAWGEPLWVILLISSSVVDYFNALWIEKYRGTPWAKLGVVFSLVFNLGVLGVFKYSGFFVENINALTGLGLPVPAFHLPLGISFYTFQTISYVIDVYRGEVPAQRFLPKFLLYVSLFPQLVAGPIVRYKDVERDINHRHFNWNDMAYGIRRFAYGLAKKVLLANTAGAAAKVFLDGDPGGLTTLGAWWGIFLFGLQIFFDFSGYSDMAIGLGRMFGFHFKENFNYPYTARSATDFWRRWHMSLSTFFRDYLYIPLGGSRRNTVLNLFIVWFLTGFWHGASWNFIIWGLFYGVLIFIERLLSRWTGKELPRLLAHPYLIIATLVGWTFFYFVDWTKALGHLGKMFTLSSELINPVLEMNFSQNLFVIILAVFLCLPWAPSLRRFFEIAAKPLVKAWDQGLGILWAAGLTVFSTVLLVGSTYNPFLYFRF